MNTTPLDKRVHDFLTQKRIAVAGVSRDRSHYPVGNLIYDRLKKTGHEICRSCASYVSRDEESHSTSAPRSRHGSRCFVETERSGHATGRNFILARHSLNRGSARNLSH